MELSPQEQERYSRHLLLEGLGGAGQERLCAARVRVLGGGQAAAWAARYLGAAGVRLVESGEDSTLEVTGGALEGAMAALQLVVRIGRGAR